MTSQSPRIYTYKITFEEVPYYYYGVHKEKRYDEEYWGSPVANKWCWELYTPKKQILELFDFTDEGYIEAQKVEGRLIKPVFNTDKWCLNANCMGVFSLDQKSKAGSKGGKISGKKNGLNCKENKIGIFSLTPEQRSEIGKKTGNLFKELKIGVCGISIEQRRENVKKSHESQKKNNTGFYGMTREQKSESGKKGGSIGGIKAQETLKSKNLGIYSLTKEQRIENGKKGGSVSGKKTYENKTGIFSLTKEQRIEISKKSGMKSKELGLGVHGRTKEEMTEHGKKSSSQKWMCLETGYVTNAGALSTYQKHRNIDTSRRIRVE
jgi:hypothetical protein